MCACGQGLRSERERQRNSPGCLTRISGIVKRFIRSHRGDGLFSTHIRKDKALFVSVTADGARKEIEKEKEEFRKEKSGKRKEKDDGGWGVRSIAVSVMGSLTYRSFT